MKLRSMMCVGAIALATAALADTYTDGKICGWVRVDSTNARTVIGVPWLNVAEDGDVEVRKLVKTDNLSDGDALYFYVNGVWKGFVLTDGAWVGTATTKTGVNGGSETIPGAEASQTLPRGQALILERPNPSGSFYLYGRYGDLTAEELTTTVNSDLTLLASPKLREIDVNASGFITGTINAADAIIMPVAGGNTVSYTRNSANTAWVKITTTQMTKFGKTIDVQTETSDGCTIPLGTGFWYRRSGEGTVTVNWNYNN